MWSTTPRNPRHWRPHSLQILNFLVLSDIFFFVTSLIILVLGAGTLVLGRPLFFLCLVLPSLLRISNYKIKIPSPQYYPYLTWDFYHQLWTWDGDSVDTSPDPGPQSPLGPVCSSRDTWQTPPSGRDGWSTNVWQVGPEIRRSSNTLMAEAWPMSPGLPTQATVSENLDSTTLLRSSVEL